MRRGFTLLEMMFVMSVIALLFILSVPNIQKVLSIVNQKGCEAQMKVIDAAILQYQLMFQEAPRSIHDLISEDLITEKQSQCHNHQTIDIVDGQAYVP